jgi:NAD(P)-dependent dehydrogenase (short-subunit alcohol dehydrogenase family)
VGAELDQFASFRLDGKVGVVTGASAGLGRRFTRVLDAGAKVVVVTRRRERLEQLAGELSDALPVQCDLSQLNLVAPFALAQHATRAMPGGEGGTIVNVASVLGLVAVGQIPQAGYAASKHGIVNLTRELSAQWARTRIPVNALARGGSSRR